MEEFKIWARENVEKPENSVRFFAIDDAYQNIQNFVAEPKWDNDSNMWKGDTLISIGFYLPKRFQDLVNCFSIDEIYQTQKEETKMKEKFTFVQDINNLKEAFIAFFT